MNDCPLYIEVYIEGIRMTRVDSTREIDFLVQEGTRPDALRELMKAHLSTGTTGTESNGVNRPFPLREAHRRSPPLRNHSDRIGA